MAYLAYQYCSQRLLTCERILWYSKEYDKALHGNDREHARKVGQTYYSALRGGTLTQEDQKAIEVDLEFMFPTASLHDLLLAPN